MGGGGEEKSTANSRVVGKSPASLLLLYPSLARVSQLGPPHPLALGLCSGRFLLLDHFPHPTSGICFANSSAFAKSLLRFYHVLSMRTPC